MTSRTRVKFNVYVDLDPVPGAFHSKESAQNIIRQVLLQRLEQYNPVISLAPTDEPEKYTDYAVRITEKSKSVILAHNGDQELEQQSYGSYFIYTSDPEKMNLILPPHVFQRCFRFKADERKTTLAEVEEIW